MVAELTGEPGEGHQRRDAVPDRVERSRLWLAQDVQGAVGQALRNMVVTGGPGCQCSRVESPGSSIGHRHGVAVCGTGRASICGVPAVYAPVRRPMPPIRISTTSGDHADA